MSTSSTINFSNLCINNKVVTCPHSNDCEIVEQGGRSWLVLRITDDISLKLDIQRSLNEITYSKWLQVPDLVLIVDFSISIPSIPTWLEPYSSVAPGCAHKLVATINVRCSAAKYTTFITHLRHIIAPMQYRGLDQGETRALWTQRCTPISNRTVGTVNFRVPYYPTFSRSDLERLKETNTWLSDSHVAFSLMDSFRERRQSNIWGHLRIQLLDTPFWSELTHDLNKFTEKYRTRVDLLGHDFVLMPIFEMNHWRLGIIENPGGFMAGKTTFHILDSYTNDSQSRRELRQLQRILLTLSPGVFDEGRIALNHAQVPLQANGKDCGCFTIYFAQRFFADPVATMALIKTPFASGADALVGWGLKDSNMTFVRHRIRTLLFQYIDRGDAIVEFEE